MFDVGYFPPIEPAASDHSSGVVRVTRLPHRSQENVSEDSARVCKIQRVVMQRFIAAPPHVGFGQAGITVSVIFIAAFVVAEMVAGHRPEKGKRSRRLTGFFGSRHCPSRRAGAWTGARSAL
jgi:hypothetical protein